MKYVNEIRDFYHKIRKALSSISVLKGTILKEERNAAKQDVIGAFDDVKLKILNQAAAKVS